MTPPTITNTCSAKTAVRPAASSFENESVREHRDLHPALAEQQVDEQQPARAGQPELVDDHRVDQVGVGRRQQRRAAHGQQRLAEAGAEQPAVGLGEQRLRDLVALLLDQRRLERVEPDRHAVLDVAARSGTSQAPTANSDQPDRHEREPVGGHVEQRQEAAEVHQRRAEVLDEEEQEHRRAPDHEQRPEVLERRDRHAEHPPRALHQQLPRVAQVGGEEDDDRELAELGRLELERRRCRRRGRRR